MFMIHKHYEQRSFQTLTRRGVTPVEILDESGRLIGVVYRW